MKTLKLRGAARYTVLSVANTPIERDQTVQVEDSVAEGLLKQSIKDRANTSWPVWEDVTPEGKAKVSRSAVKKTRRPRKAKQTETAGDAA